MAHPLINFGQVKHSRLRPVVNRFSYGVFTLKIPMRERNRNPELLKQYGMGDNQWAFYSFYDRDHGHGTENSLTWAESLFEQEGISIPDGEIWLQTFPRVLGYVFNPVSFWIYTDAHQAVRAILTEVNNTFGERHCYLLHKKDGGEIFSGETLISHKIFHVSPFCDVSGEYQFRFLFSKDSQRKMDSVCRIELYTDHQPLIYTSISGQDFPLSRSALSRAKLRYPMMTFGVIARIHWQALKLWLKGVPFHSKPTPPRIEVSS
ncbi:MULTISPECIES: DUF1365 domain-containing protein [unclassified Polynucleobacter]|uniref:DUF1365 domain-containing protein n=1 Tax=unclassified Polynucleobacter TaxID=2640945 RepID=UPI0025731026|nr:MULTISPECIES: DUF1365 domain-containing protein [unclassified Polynucleobacter]BEI43534.1 DUF1365 domain-containing protein [Polynucleobacter sp. HIN10]BEI45308.1 DUF1365 domain-containing protein [Polynucleobacter sp. HIN11]